MKKYVAIYLASAEKLNEWMTASPETKSKWTEEWNLWQEKHKDSIVDPGAPLGKTKRISVGGVTDTNNEMCGYTVVEAASHDGAIEIFADNPHIREDGTWIDVLEWLEMK